MKGIARSKGRWSSLLCALTAGMLLAACGKQAPDTANAPRFAAPPAQTTLVEYSFGVTPMSNFRNIYDVFQPILDHINAGLPDARLVLEVPRSLIEHEQRLQTRSFAFALSNPYLTWSAVQRGGYRIFAKMGDDAAFRGMWMVRKDSGIKSLADLKGKKIAFPPRSALAATMMTQMQLKKNGIDPATDIEPSYVGSQHASIMGVFQKNVAAGATWPLAWITFQRTHPGEARQLEVRFPTEPLVNQGIVARNDVPPDLVRRVGQLMAEMSETGKGRALLAQVPISAFEPAGDVQYDVVRVFMEQHRQAFPAAAL